MTSPEAIVLAHRRGVTLEVFLGKLRVCSEGEPDESLVRLLRDNKQAVMAAILATETESDHWRRIFAEKIEIIVTIRGLPRAEAKREALAHVLIEYLKDTHSNTDPTRCAHCGRPETPDQTLLPIGDGDQHTFLHSDCWGPWREGRRRAGVAALTKLGVLVQRTASRQVKEERHDKKAFAEATHR
jgi:hypothetical protein